MKLVYSRDGNDYALEPTTDEDTLATAIGLVAEAYGVQPASVTYLLNYGWKQSLQDAAAQPMAEARAEAKKALAEGKAVDEAKLVAEAASGAMSKRADAIIAGTVSVRVGEARDPLRAIAREMLYDAAKRKGIKLGSDKEAINKKVDEVLAKHKAAIEAEYNRRKATDISIEL